MKRIIATVLIAITTFSLQPLPARANFGGVNDEGDPRVLAILNGVQLIDGVRHFSEVCSGSMVTPQVVVAAAHCLGNSDHIYTSEIYTPKNLYVSRPGANLDTQNPTDPVKVMRVILTSGYDNSFHPEVGNYITQKDDIAFYFLASPLVESYTIPISTASDVAQIKSEQLMITHIGYGLHGIDLHDGMPRLVQLRASAQGSSRYGNNPARDDYTITSNETGEKALCPGDSGSPWYATVGGIEKLTAVLVSASGCRTGSNQKGGTMGTLIWPYLDLMNKHWSEFQADLPSLIANDSSFVDTSHPYIERQGGCDALVNAWLQIQGSDGGWSDFKEAQGWKSITTCPTSNPYHPWVRAVVPNGATIRWKIVSPDNSWGLLTEPYVYLLPEATPTPILTPSLAPVSEVTPLARVDETPTPSQNPPRTVPIIKQTVTFYCVKGRSTKKLQGVKAVCPKGYKPKK